MAVDMADRYGIAVEDAYAFALEKVDPDKVWLNSYGIRKRYVDPYPGKLSKAEADRDKYRGYARQAADAYRRDPKSKYAESHKREANVYSKKAYDAEKRYAESLRERDDYFNRLRSRGSNK